MSEKIDFTAEMQGLIDEAYILFNRAIGKSLNVCKPCCVSFEMEKELVETPVSRLSRSAIYDYLEAVHYDELNCEIRHFLPRILEFVVQ